MPDFDYEIELPVRFRDLDVMGHVNNAIYATYIEHARVNYVEDVVGEEFLETGAVVANLEIDFQRPIDFGESVTVAVAARELGTSSIPLSYEIRVGGEVAAVAETTMIVFDRDAGEPRPIPDRWRDHITDHEGL